MGRIALVVWACLFAVVTWAQDTATYQQGGSAIFDAISAAVKTESGAAGLSTPAGPILVAANQEQALKDLQKMESDGTRFVYAIGTGASALASNRQAFSGIYVFVPNPAPSGLMDRPKWSGVSPYPDLRGALRYVKETMNAKRVGVLYTKKVNEAVARLFEQAAVAEKVSCLLLGFSGPEELDGTLSTALKDVDVLLLPIDPLTFSPETTRFIVSVCLQAKKPAVGFLENATATGVPIALYCQPEEIARTAVAAMKALKQNGEDRKVWYPSRFALSVNEESAKRFGVTYDSSKVASRH